MRLIGYSPDEPSSILAKVSEGAKPSYLKGDFILIAEGSDLETRLPLTIFISTVVAAIPYYYYLSESHVKHSDNVIDCCHMAGLNWQWNWDSLAQLALFDHLLGNTSLHKSILRIPNASIIKITGTNVEKYHEPFWEELYEINHLSNINEASDILLDILSELPNEINYSLSLSAGYDSRLLLSCLHHLKRKTVIASMGYSNSTDSSIAQQLAYTLGLDFKRIEIQPDDYITYANDILKTTSGEKLFWHWHTGIYTKKVGFDPHSIQVVGSNGEFARSYYFDKGFIADFIDRVGFSRWDLLLILKNSARRRVPKEVLTKMGNQFDFHENLCSSIQMQGSFVSGMRFGDGLDYFYCTQRVRHFIGMGLALYRLGYTTMSPFLDSRFIRYVAGLQRQDKLRNNMHRSIIKKLCPDLLDFPTDESGIPMGQQLKKFYFLNHSQVKSYNCVGDAQNLSRVTKWARLGFDQIGGDSKLLDSDANLNKQVMHWNLPITIGAFLELLQKEGINCK